jgi:hypothetical protein
LGLDDAGKTTILFRLKLGETITTKTTIGEHIRTFRVIVCLLYLYVVCLCWGM